MGSLILSTVSIAVLKASIYVADQYSMRRKVAGTHGQPTPIISFRTHQLPILYALAQVFVLKAFAKDPAERLVVRSLDPRIRYGIAAVFKAVIVHHVQGSLFALAERCGAQGLFEENQIIANQVRTVSDTVSDMAYLSLH
jgi:acyl-CoA oxidase